MWYKIYKRIHDALGDFVIKYPKALMILILISAILFDVIIAWKLFTIIGI